MPLSNEQIQKIVKEKKRRKELQDGVSHQRRLQFHTETILNKHNLSPYSREFLNWIGEEKPELLAKDKFDRFRQLLKAPIQTIELTESIYSRLFRVFHAEDSYFNYEFNDETLESDWSEYCDKKFWPTIGFQAMQTAIDSVWIAELPAEQITEYPAPKNRLINIEDVIDIKNDQYNNCLYVIFKLGDYVYAYDDESFRVYEENNNKLKLLGEAKHDLEYTPARMMWSDKLQSNNYINKEAPITKELTDLDWLLFHMTSKRYMDLANAYPEVYVYENDDDYEDDDLTDNEQRTEGKKPAGNKHAGAGGYFRIDPPREGESDLMQYGPVKIVSPDTDALKWHVDEEVRLTEKIFKAVVGSDMEVKNDAAKNEMQIESAFESQESVLMRVKRNFEIIHQFADNTICKLRYGERFIGCEIDYGTNFFLKDVYDLQEDLKEAKESGAGIAVIEAIGNNIISTKYRDDKNNITRASIIGELDPLPNYNIKEAIDIYKNGGIDKINFIIKSNLINFVRRFERENINIVKFGSLGSFSRKIEQIRRKFEEYAKEQNNVEQQRPGIT